MIISCNSKCKLKGGTTSGKVDLESNEVICDHCGESITNISQFMKNTMKFNGQIIKKSSKKPFEFLCLTCNEKVPTILKGEEVVCESCDKGCKFDVSKFTINAMKTVNNKEEQDFEEEEEEEDDLDE